MSKWNEGFAPIKSTEIARFLADLRNAKPNISDEAAQDLAEKIAGMQSYLTGKYKLVIQSDLLAIVSPAEDTSVSFVVLPLDLFLVDENPFYSVYGALFAIANNPATPDSVFAVVDPICDYAKGILNDQFNIPVQ